MISYLIKRLLEMIPTLLGITLISFFIIHLAPGKPTDILTELNPKITPEARERLEKLYNLDKPVIIQYGLWLKRIVKLDFGESFSTDRRAVMQKIWDKKQSLLDRRLFITLMINLITFAIILIIAIPIGVSSATHQNSLYDKLMTTTVFIGFAMPSFWFALLFNDVLRGIFRLASDFRSEISELRCTAFARQDMGQSKSSHPPCFYLGIRRPCGRFKIHEKQYA